MDSCPFVYKILCGGAAWKYSFYTGYGIWSGVAKMALVAAVPVLMHLSRKRNRF